MDDLRSDFVYALRKLRASPAFAVTAILTLAVGIGANTAVLNLVNAALLRPPAVREPGELAWLSPQFPGGRHGHWALPDYFTFRDAARSWSGVAAFGNVEVTIGGDSPTHVSGKVVSANYFELLGVPVRPGRGFVAREDTATIGSTPVILGHAFWRSRFGGDSSIVGRAIPVNTQPMVVIGIAPAGFNGLEISGEVAVWLPVGALPVLYGARHGVFTGARSRWMSVVGRREPAASLQDAATEAAALSASLESYLQDADDRRTLRVLAVRGALDPNNRAQATPVITLVMLVPLLVLGVACANVANLFVARSVEREKELAVRRALGASRGRLVRQLLTECAVLGLVAGLAGMITSYLLTAVTVSAGAFPPDIAVLLVPDLRVLAATILLAVVAGALFGLVPALASTSHQITPSLKAEGFARGGGRGRHRLRNTFVVSQVAFSLSLLITAGLFVGSLRKALAIEPGFDPANAVSASFDLSAAGYDTTRSAAFTRQLVERIASEPGAQGVALANVLPLSGSSSATSVRREGDAPESGVESFNALVSDAYFATMRVGIIRGRTFDATDTRTSTRVAIVNERLAELLWPGQDPIGRRFGNSDGMFEVVGVARNGRYRSLAERVPAAYYWMAASQRPALGYGVVVARFATGSDAAVGAIRRAFAALDPGLPLSRVRTLEAGIASTIDGQRGGAAMLGVFGTLALGLAALGIVGVIAHGVTARRREIGIRMSLGAQGPDVVRSFVREGLGLALIGATIGIAMSAAASRLLASLLFGLTATDVMTFVAASAVLLAVAVAASWLPARRAARVDPLIALRGD